MMNEQSKNIPTTLGIIMDGNGRWALQRNKSRSEGHTYGIKNMVKLISRAFDLGVKNVVCYGLSIENLQREEKEIAHIYQLITGIYDYFVDTFTKKQATLQHFGNTSVLPERVLEAMKSHEAALSPFANTGRRIYIAVAYGSRQEIVNAVNSAIKKGESVTEESFLNMLAMPVEPDLIIRTGGERRLSNFLLYQASYAELYFSDKFFPDFTEADLEEALDWFSTRKRRYGLVENDNET